MPNRVLLIFLGLLLGLATVTVAACGNDGEIVVREPTTPVRATPTPVIEEP